MSTFAMIKPESVARGEHLKILEFIERGGFSIKNMRLQKLSEDESKFLYAEHEGKDFYNDLIRFTTSGPSILLELSYSENPSNTVDMWRMFIGPSDPKINGAPTEGFGELPTLRWRLACEGGPDNGVHGSDRLESAKRELEFFFGGGCQVARSAADSEKGERGNKVQWEVLRDSEVAAFESQSMGTYWLGDLVGDCHKANLGRGVFVLVWGRYSLAPYGCSFAIFQNNNIMHLTTTFAEDLSEAKRRAVLAACHFLAVKSAGEGNDSRDYVVGDLTVRYPRQDGYCIQAEKLSEPNRFMWSVSFHGLLLASGLCTTRDHALGEGLLWLNHNVGHCRGVDGEPCPHSMTGRGHYDNTHPHDCGIPSSDSKEDA